MRKPIEINEQQLLKWIQALDSGKYKQSKGELQNRDGYCCLGVACRVLLPKKSLNLDSEGFLQGGFPESHDSPQWLIDVNEDFSNKTGETLVFLNDELKFTFSEIATLLELVYIHKILE